MLMNGLQLERPPTYSSIDPAGHAGRDHNEPKMAGTRELEVHSSASGSSALHIKQNGNTLYYLGHHQAVDTPDMILHAGYDAHGPQLALANFIPYSKDLKTYIGGLKSPTGDDWDMARCAGGGLFKDPSYRFETKGDDQTGKKAKYYWKKTSESKLGASRWSPKDHKLVDESNEEVVAVYAEHRLGSQSHRGTIRFQRKMNEFAEMQAVMVLLALLEMSRRYMKTVNRAFPSNNGGF